MRELATAVEYNIELEEAIRVEVVGNGSIHVVAKDTLLWVESGTTPPRHFSMNQYDYGDVNALTGYKLTFCRFDR